MHPSPPPRPQRRRPLTRVAAAAALVSSILTVGVVAQDQLAAADPASGEGQLTVTDNGHWFEYSGNGEPYFMAGSGGPEGFLYYSDARRQSIVDQLIANDVRAVYIHAVRSNGGDGGNDENPFVGNNPANGVDPAVLDEWDSYLSQLDAAGIVTWFHLYDDGARPFGACNPDLPAAEKAFVKTIVERFRDYQHLVWLPTEEHVIKACSNNSIDIEKAEALAAEIRLHDQVHPLGVHHNNGQSNQYLGNDDIDVFAQQVCQQSQFTSVDGIHDAGEFGEDVYVMAECHPWHKDLLDAGQRTTLRQSFWSSVMAGGYVLFYDAWESTDPTVDMLADIGRINAFMDTTRFAETVPADELAAAGTKWVLGNEAVDVYIAYSNTNPSSMGVQGVSAGTYDLGWFDPVTGVRVEQTVTVDAGTAIFPVPSQIGNEVALSIEPSGGTPPPTTAPPTTAPPTTAPPTTAPPTTAPPTTVNPGSTVELVATQDAYLEGAKAFDTGELRVESGTRSRITYARFDTSGVTSASAVTLSLTVGSDPGNGTVQISLGSGGSWTEATLTPSNAPTASELLASVDGPFTTGQQIDFVLPAGVTDGDQLDLVLTTTGAGGDDVSFVSSEGANGPTLQVTTSTTPPTTAPPTTAPPTTAPPSTTPSTTAPPTGPTRLLASEDAFIQNAQAIDGKQLRVEAGTRSRISYVRFDTSGVSSQGGSVTLELSVGGDSGDGTVTVWRGVGGDWTSDTLTLANAPAAGERLASASGPFTPGQLIQFSLPADSVDGLLDLVITTDGQGADDVSFDAIESGNGPELVIAGSPTTPSTTTPSTTTPSTTTPPTNPPTTSPPTGELATVRFTGIDGAVANPERGFHVGVRVADSVNDATTSAAQMSSMYADGIRLARMYVRLDDYRNGPIPQSQLDALDQVFANARAGGIKLIPRFSYNFGSAPDATVERIEQHIQQLTPTLRANADVIAVLQAGFIGAWGEWHSSTNGLTNPEDRARVRTALLAALPADRMIQLRYPDDIIEVEPQVMTDADAWSGSTVSRTGHKNDCFLANDHDAGTYIPLTRKSEFVDYLATMTEFTPMGGETCQVTLSQQRTDCPTALAELELLHWDYLNLQFYGGTIDRWRSEGCFDEIEARLGYRYEMVTATASTRVSPGARLTLRLDVANEGFGKLFNPRPIDVVLVNRATGAATSIEAVADARSVLPGPGTRATLDLGVTVPGGLAAGTYDIHVELPDAAPALADDARYSIRMANAGTWAAATGSNDLGLEVIVAR